MLEAYVKKVLSECQIKFILNEDILTKAKRITREDAEILIPKKVMRAVSDESFLITSGFVTDEDESEHIVYLLCSTQDIPYFLLIIDDYSVNELYSFIESQWVIKNKKD